MHSFVILISGLALASASPLAKSQGSATNSSSPPSNHDDFAPINGSQSSLTSPTSSWWYPNLDHSSAAIRDYVPNLYTGNSPDYNYQVYFAVAGGDTSGFIQALYAGGPNGDRDNWYLAGEPRVVYLGPGTYVVNSTIYLDTDTVIIGDAANPPTIQAQSDFDGDYLICGGQNGPGNGGELHFSVMIKNVVLDTRSNADQSDFAALSWRVAQNSALVNVNIFMPQGTHTGIWMGQGSTIQVGDVSFSYGNIGLHYDGSQQATLKNLSFQYCTTGILIDGGSTINIFAPTFNTVGNSVVFNSGSPWVSVVDGISINSGTFFNSVEEYPNFMLENISKDTTNSAMVVVNGKAKVGGVASIDTYVYGNTYGANPVYQTNPSQHNVPRPTILAPGGRYPISTAPQYLDATTDDIINLKDSTQNGGYTIHGDGTHDDGQALQSALNTAASVGKIAFLPFGIYLTSTTITIPLGTQLVGNAWSTISGYGPSFQDESSPVPIVQVGNNNDVGIIQIQDMRFTVNEELPGAIVLQINAAGSNPGDVAIYNSLVTVGGTRDTKLSCSDETNCRGAYLGLYLTPSSSAYVDNFWAWVADHASDDSTVDVRIAAKGGVQIDSNQGTWLSGLGSEHWWLFNLNYNSASNVFNSLLQSETNYHQGSSAVTSPPAPFTATSADPDFSWCSNSDATCSMTVAQYINGGSDIFNYAAGSWNFFGGTQDNMNVIISEPDDLYMYGLTDHEAEYIMRLPDGSQFGDGSSDGFGGSWGTLVAEYSSST